MTLWNRLERVGLVLAMALPARVQRLLAGRPVVRDGQTLAVDVQLVLRLRQVLRKRGAETHPIPQGREVILADTRLTGGRQPIGGVGDLTVAGRPARLYVPSQSRRSR